MHLIRDNKITLEFTGKEEINLITSILQKCTTKQAPKRFLMRGDKDHFSPDEKKMIITLTDLLDKFKA